MVEIRSENPKAEEGPRPGEEALEGERWSGRGPVSGKRSPRELEFVDWYPPAAEPKPPLARPVALTRWKRWVVYAGLPALVLFLLVGFLMLQPWKGERRREGPVPPTVEAPNKAPPEPPRSASLSLEDRYYRTWYLLTKTAEGEGLRVRSTFETPEKVERELKAMGPPAQGPPPFNHQRFFYFSVTLEATRGVLSPGFVLQAPSRFTLVDDRGHRVKARMLPELEEWATVLEVEGKGIAEANFYLAFPKEPLSTSSASLTLEAPGRKAGETLVLTWQLPIRYPE